METLYKDDWVRICCIDCLIGLKELPDKSVNAIITDPPYGVGKKYVGPYVDKGGPEYWEFMHAWFELAMKKTDLIVFTPGSINLIEWIRYKKPTWVCCWHHGNCGSHGYISYYINWEPVLVYGKPYKRSRHDAWHIPVAWQSAVGNNFPIPKPEKLWDQLVLDFTNPGDLIVDPFIGSGTTAVSCKKLGRRCIGMDISRPYCSFMARRCSQQVLPLKLEEIIESEQQTLPF